jgi:hypothetical protein
MIQGLEDPSVYFNKKAKKRIKNVTLPFKSR